MASSPIGFLQSENVRLKDENEELKEEVRTLREFVTVLNDLSQPAEIASDAQLLPLIKDIFLKALHLLDAPDGSLCLIDEDTDELVFMLVHGALADKLTGFRIDSREGIAGWVFKNAETALVRDVRHDNRFSHMIDEEFKFKTQSIAAAPLIGNGKVFGVIEALNQPGDAPFSETDSALLSLLCRVAGERLADIERKGKQD